MSASRSTGFDSGERKQAELALQESEERFRKIVEQAPIAMAIVGMDGTIEFINRKAVEVFGYVSEDIPTMERWWAQAYPDEQYRNEVVTGWMSLVNKAIQEGTEIPGHEYQVTCKDGTVKTMVISGAHISGKVFVLFDDMTKRKQAEVALRESNEKYSNVFRTSPDAITVTRLSDGMFLEINQSFTDTTGYSPQEILGRTTLASGLSLWLNEEDRHRMVAGLKAHRKVVGLEAPMRMKDGAIRTVMISARILEIKGQECVLAVARDITERKQMEQALQESEQHYRMVSELATDYVFKLGVAADGAVTMDFVSDNFYALTGRTKDDAKTVNLWGSIIHPEDLGKTIGLLRKLVTHPQSTEFECRSYIHGGKLRWVGIVARSEWDERQQRVTAIVGAVKDISERKWAEAAIAEERERLAVTLRSIGDGVITTDTSGAVVIMNRVAEELTGWTQGEAVGQLLDTVFNIVNETTRAPCESPVEKVLSTGRIVELASHALLVSRHGTEKLIADSGAPITDRDGKTIGVVLVFRDMTEKQRALEVMQRAAKLDSLGILAGGIAHDFNNLLTGIFGYVELARARSTDEQALEYLDGTLAAMNRARALSMQLLTFAKGGAPAQKPTQVIPLIREAVQFALSGANVSCQFFLPDDLWLCHIDRNQIAQVIDNIVINAQQAMPGGGLIDVAAKNIFVDEGQLPALAKGNYVKLSVKDRGIGIPKDVLPHIFDPFYTTKTKGHGLGLATCYSIVSRHGGCLDVESEPGKGSTFYIYLPAAADSAAADAVAAVKRKGRGRILLVNRD